MKHPTTHSEFPICDPFFEVVASEYIQITGVSATLGVNCQCHKKYAFPSMPLAYFLCIFLSIENFYCMNLENN